MKQIPTFREILEAYPQVAAIERAKCERPSLVTVANVVSGVRNILAELGDGWFERKISDLNRRKIDGYLATASGRGHGPLTAWSYVFSLRALTARWTRSYYADMGWRIPPFDLPSYHRKPIRYVRTERSLLLKIKKWYEGLEIRADKREWIVVTLMLEFAMRNSDVRRLHWRDFRFKDDRIFLCYTPHKTELSSGRMVCWPVCDDLWAKLIRVRELAAVERERQVAGRRGRPRNQWDEGAVVPCAGEIFARLNRELRKDGLFIGNKGLYELRKICIDHVYQKFGAEMASSISGDDIRTVTRYYADPSAVNLVNVRIVDLL